MIRPELREIEFSLPEFIAISARYSPVVSALAGLAMLQEGGRLIHMSATLARWGELMVLAFDDGRAEEVTN